MVITVVVFVVGVAVGAVGSYLFLRANKNKKAVVDAFADKASRELKD